jgi:nicotinamidase-related amidase
VWQEGDERGLDACVEGLEPKGGETVVVKKFASAFFGTSLASQLVMMGVDTLVICGVSTSGYVRVWIPGCIFFMVACFLTLL